MAVYVICYFKLFHDMEIYWPYSSPMQIRSPDSQLDGPKRLQTVNICPVIALLLHIMVYSETCL